MTTISIIPEDRLHSQTRLLEMLNPAMDESGNSFWKRLGYEIAVYHLNKSLASGQDKHTLNSCLTNKTQ